MLSHAYRWEGAEPGYALRFPRLVSFRENDKKPEDATTVEELIELYQSQGQRKARLREEERWKRL